ncbi:MAG: hypothetical protein JKY20_11430, partial [Alphaproteobacteria bacterium]|nr:hypothetical protein [Alphaproteobacteria bacterium]
MAPPTDDPPAEEPSTEEPFAGITFDINTARRIVELSRGLTGHFKGVVSAGPFAGMKYGDGVADGCLVPKLLGCYEMELHHAIADALSRSPDLILNIGCAEGYYAVGLARLLPDARIIAYDINEYARERCAETARINGVEDRITIKSEIKPEDFAAFEGRRVLVICDIEGGEYELLNPTQTTALGAFDLIVETHPLGEKPTITFAARFAKTHEIQIIQPAARDPSAYPVLSELSHT